MGGHNIDNLRYADDTVLISENEKDLQQLLNIVESKSKENGLGLNSKKTEVMVISRKARKSPHSSTLLSMASNLNKETTSNIWEL